MSEQAERRSGGGFAPNGCSGFVSLVTLAIVLWAIHSWYTGALADEHQRGWDDMKNEVRFSCQRRDPERRNPVCRDMLGHYW